MRQSTDEIDPLVSLMRRFTVDWLDRGDPQACQAIMAPGYTATVGGVELRGRDAYLTATLEQLCQFPGLMLTVHELFAGDAHVALRFTEHGIAAGHGPMAAWAGIGIFTWDGSRLTANVTEEDYLARRRQLKSGRPDLVAPPAIAPWSATREPSDADAEEAVVTWLASKQLADEAALDVDDGWSGQPTPPLLGIEEITIDTLFSAGPRVAFHATARGRYTGGLDVPDPPPGVTIELRVCGMVEVSDTGTVTGHLVRDRAGLRRDLIGLAKQVR